MNAEATTRDGIEVHWDEKRGYLDLACESDAFNAYRELVRQQLTGFPEIDLNSVREVRVTDTEKFVAAAAARRHFEWIVFIGVVAVVALAAIGLAAVVIALTN